jgi:hypothetical protein
MIEKYIAGNTTYTLIRAKYGNQRVTTTTNKLQTRRFSYLDDTGSHSSNIILILVDPHKQKQLEEELANLKMTKETIARGGNAKKNGESRLRGELDRMEQEKVFSLKVEKQMNLDCTYCRARLCNQSCKGPRTCYCKT